MNGVMAYRAVMKCWADTDVEQLAALFNEDAVYEDPTSGVLQGREAILVYMRDSIAALGEVSFDTVAEMAEADASATEWVMHLRFKGRDVALRGMTVLEMREDLISRQRDYFDPRDFAASSGR